jgi:hypothetical protein
MTRTIESHEQGRRDRIAFLNTYKMTIRVTQSLPDDELLAETMTRWGEFLRQRIKPPNSCR